jgi:hypothetical protein
MTTNINDETEKPSDFLKFFYGVIFTFIITFLAVIVIAGIANAEDKEPSSYIITRTVPRFTSEIGVLLLPVVGGNADLISKDASAFGVSYNARFKFTQTASVVFKSDFMHGDDKITASGGIGVQLSNIQGLPPTANLWVGSDFTAIVDGRIGGQGDSVGGIIIKIVAPLK